VGPERTDIPPERLEILARDLEPKAVARIHIRGAEKRCQALTVRRVARNDRPDARRDSCAPAAELVEVVHLGQVRGEDDEHRLVDRLGNLVELEGCDGERAVSEVALEAAVELGCMVEVALEGLSSKRVVHGRRELRDGDGDAARVVERHALSHDIAKERAALRELLAHVVDRVHDEADRRVTCHLAGILLTVCPERLVRSERRAPDQHQDVQVAYVAACAIVHPVAAHGCRRGSRARRRPWRG
jgi:hypothetical protein